MTGLVRKGTLLTAAGLLVAGAAWAGNPNEALSTFPTHINLTGYSNPPDPAGTVTYIIRDGGGFLVDGVGVTLDFSLCTDVLLSQNNSGTGLTTNCLLHTVTGTTNPQGELVVNVVAGGNGIGVPRALIDCVRVFVGGDPWLLASASAATFDRDGANGVGAGDRSLVIYDFVNNPTAARSDLNNDGSVGAGDLSLVNAVFVLGGSALSGLPYCAP